MPPKILYSCARLIRLIQEWPPRFHICSNSLALTTPSQESCQTFPCSLPLLISERARLALCRLFSWIFRLGLDRRWSQRHEDWHPSPQFLLGHSTWDRTSALRVELLAFYQWFWFNRECRYSATDRHGRRKLVHQQSQLKGGSPWFQCSSAKHSHCHTCVGTHHRSRRPGWSGVTRDFLWSKWCSRDSGLSMQAKEGMFRLSRIHGLQSHPWKGSWCGDNHSQL